MYKQVIVVRSDLKMGRGKIASQVAHASLCSYERAGFLSKRRWKKGGAKKVVLKVGSIDELLKIYGEARKKGLPCCLIRDAGKTQVKSGEVTCVGIGPCKESAVDWITGKLKLL